LENDKVSFHMHIKPRWPLLLLMASVCTAALAARTPSVLPASSPSTAQPAGQPAGSSAAQPAGQSAAQSENSPVAQFSPPPASASAAPAVQASAADSERWRRQAARVTIIRDQWGIPHVYGKSDADAVFGLLYAQAEDDFKRIEMNYINALGRLAEVEGEAELYRDLRMKLFIDPKVLRVKYARSPRWLQDLMNSFADGLNFYLYTHPGVKPRLITHFEPWMALAFSEGSIGGDIESVELAPLQQFYAKPATLGKPASSLPFSLPFSWPSSWPFSAGGKEAADSRAAAPEAEPGGSNGFAIAPSRSASGHAMLMINPHTSFYFRPEVQVVSDQGLNAYGAVTWGQFFVYQGFNERLGWMHTSGGGDVIDEYLETMVEQNGHFFYRYGSQLRPMREEQITLPYKTASGMQQKTVTAYFSHHGPIIRAQDGKWVAVKMLNDPVQALTQSYLRTKAKNYAQFYETMKLRTNSSNNTVYADADGNIAYFHGNFIPRRDPRFDWKHAVDGSDPATEWQGLHAVEETIMLKNPPNGWLQNTNNWPFSAAGKYSPRQQDYPSYMWENPENARGVHAVRVFENAKPLSLDGLIAAASDNYLTAFDVLLPKLLAAWDGLPAGDPLRAELAEQIDVLRNWDRRYDLASVPTSLAVFWGQDLLEHASAAARKKEVPTIDYIGRELAASEYLQALRRASVKLERDFGGWRTPWGDINRFQRLSGAIDAQFDDAKPSLPVAFTSSTWGSLAAFGMTGKGTTRHIYGDRGNSFVAAVEFGPRVQAKSVLAGGESGDPASPHFNDQAEMYSKGQFKRVLFYRSEVERQAERTYHPGR